MTITAQPSRRQTSSRRFTAAEFALLAVVVLAMLHHADHVLRGDHSGWPFKDEFSPFTISLIVYPIAVLILLQRSRPWLRVGLMGLVYVATQAAHLLIELPGDQYGMWATNSSTVDDTLGDPNLLDLESQALGFVAASISILLSIAMVVTLILLIQEARRQKRSQL